MNGKSMGGREAALLLLNRIEQQGAYANLAASEVFEKYTVSRQERAFASELMLGVLRNRMYLDHALSQFLSRPLSKTPLPIRNILRLSAYQLLFLENLPQSAVCNEAVHLARRYGHEGTARFVNGVLRSFARGRQTIQLPDADADPEAYLSIRYSLPEWLIAKFISDFGLDFTKELVPALNEKQPVSIRVNRLRTSVDLLRERLAAEGIRTQTDGMTDCGLLVTGAAVTQTKAFVEGLFTVQGTASQLASEALCPRPGERVLDVCAAPGGKTTHLAEQMQNHGEIIAWDLHPHKIPLIDKSAQRLGITCIRACVQDATVYVSGQEGAFDKILCDVPCSGLGILAKKPDIRYNKKVRDFSSLLVLQEKILENASRYLRPGGELVYSTCTINPQENGGQIKRFLDRHTDFVRCPLPEKFSRIPGIDPQTGEAALFPHLHRTDGFYIAKLKRLL